MADQFDPQGTSRLYWIDTIAGIASGTFAPTVAELTAATRLDCYVLPDGFEGLSQEPGYTESTTMCDTAQRFVRGLATTTNGSLTLTLASLPADAGTTIFTGLKADEGKSGWLVELLQGAGTGGTFAAADLIDVYPVQMTTVMPARTAGVKRYMVGFAMRGAPVLGLAVLT